MTDTEAKTKTAGVLLVTVGAPLLLSLIAALWLVAFRVVPLPVEGAAVAAGVLTLAAGGLSCLLGAFALGWDG